MSTASRGIPSPYQQDLKEIDPKVLADAMGDNDQPPEEPLLSAFEDGFGYHTAVAVGRFLGKYLLVRKVCLPTSPSQPWFDHRTQLGWATCSSVWLAG